MNKTIRISFEKDVDVKVQEAIGAFLATLNYIYLDGSAEQDGSNEVEFVENV